MVVSKRFKFIQIVDRDVGCFEETHMHVRKYGG
jgi:hypothetical protein